MGSHSEVMHCYEQIAPLTERMLLLARTRKWSDLPALETQHSSLVDRLKEIEPLHTLDQAQLARKYQLLSRITANFREISGMVVPQLASLLTVMQSLDQQQNLRRAYGQDDVQP